LLLLIVVIGLVNVCLGFGLAMYFGYGPPGLQGIFDSLGPMPAPATDSLPASAGLGAPCVPLASPSSSPAVASSQAMPSDDQAEENVLGEVQELATTAQSAMLPGEVQSHD
jgi:hypothetical protein